ncbi:MAG: response regulator transcription factor [Acutalibacteraceae bacterium]|nr:response regulator transcription factor [Acutalibacteraceae bacterium]
MKRRIIIADSDKQSVRLIKNLLSAAGYETVVAQNFSECFTLVSLNTPDIVIVDPLFPLPNGIKTVKKLRERGSFPIIAICENGSERAVTETLDAGADDYIRKPFLSGELISRIKAAVRRIEQYEKLLGIDNHEGYEHGNLQVNYNRNSVKVDGNDIHLTKNEFKILSLLCKYSGRVLTYDFIIKSVWGEGVSGGNGILRVNITNLRKKIEQNSGHPQYLFTENGVGYRMAENQREASR